MLNANFKEWRPFPVHFQIGNMSSAALDGQNCSLRFETAFGFSKFNWRKFFVWAGTEKTHFLTQDFYSGERNMRITSKGLVLRLRRVRARVFCDRLARNRVFLRPGPFLFKVNSNHPTFDSTTKRIMF